jgi:hypothetical protein
MVDTGITYIPPPGWIERIDAGRIRNCLGLGEREACRGGSARVLSGRSQCGGDRQRSDSQ